LEYQLRLLERHGFDDVILCTGYLSEVIESYFGEGEQLGVRLRYTREPRALGTAGAVVQVPFELAESFLVLYGDVFVNVDLSRLAEFHRARNGAVTLAVHPSEHPYDSDLVEVDRESSRVTGFPGRPSPGDDFVNLTSAALYVMNRNVVARIPTDRPTDFARDLFPALHAEGTEFYAYETDEYIHDMGTVDRYERVVRDVRRMMDERAGSLFGP
jgi:NDP-sugar pyrophosphorylase family protein